MFNVKVGKMTNKTHTPKTLSEIHALVDAGKLKYHHSALFQGYISRKNPDGIVQKYSGKFGKGYKVLKPNWNSTRYSEVSYYVEV